MREEVAGGGLALLPLELLGVEEAVRVATEATQGVVVTFPAPTRLGLLGRLGKCDAGFGLELIPAGARDSEGPAPELYATFGAREPQPACWLTALRDDCAVDVFNLRMRLPLPPELLAPGGRPGREG